MRLAITMRVVDNPTYPDRRDALSLQWPDYLARLFPQALLIPLLNHPRHIEQAIRELALDGVILSGGNDWGQAPERDETEQRVVACCREEGIPLLGVCRGLQVLNVLAGGSLVTDLGRATGVSHVAVEHPVSLAGEPFVSLAGSQTLPVNSYHNQGVLQTGLAAEFIPFALAAGGVVEGIYHPDLPLLAVQWHPERPGPSAGYDRMLIRRFFLEGGIQ